MRSVMKHSFSEIPKVNIPRSSFNRSHGHKTTFDSGVLVPFLVDEALPGDTYNVDLTAFARMATPIFPLMDNLYMDTHYFAVPMRLVWDNWQKFNGEQVNPGDSTDFLVPTLSPPAGGYTSMSLEDYMALPVGVEGFEHSALWHRAYNLIWNEWFRDQNLQDSLPVPTGDGPDDPASYTLLRRGKRHDYFTSALPWPQKGESVDIPLGSIAPVISNGEAMIWTDSQGGDYRVEGGNAPGGADPAYVITRKISDGTYPGAIRDQLWGSQSGLVADLSSATAATVNQLRQAFQVQKLMEKDARGGTRYTEIVRSHFGVTSPDARVQRPEYLGGGSSPILISPVVQTSASDETSPQGNLAAMGTATLRNHGFTKSFSEHCLIIGLVSVRADLTYQQGLNRMWSRQTRYDFYWPSLAHIGEQAILNKEIFCQGTADDENVFGYQERFAEYRYKTSNITGRFRSKDALTLDSWHLSQDFANLPVLDSTFIEENPPIDRVVATPDEPDFLFDSYIRMNCARPMPTYSVPGFIDHF